MNKKLIYILFLFFVQGFILAQETANEEYLKSTPSTEKFNANHWKKIKQTMIKEARGNSKSKGKEFEGSDFEKNNQSASYYEYEEESFSGEYAKNNGERLSDYEYNEESKNYKKGEGEDDFSYDRKNHNIEKGEYFSKKKEYRENKTRVKETNNNLNGGDGIGTFGSIILYTLLAIFLGLIIYFLFINTTVSEEGKKVSELEIEKAPLEITKSELELMLEDALKKEDYRLAVRIYFIFVLKNLSEKEWIVWKKEKTNFSYLMEMRGKKQYELFNESVSVFELVWYGDYNISNKDYSVIEPKFKTLLKELSAS